MDASKGQAVKSQAQGLSVLGAISFIVGDIVGAGIVTLPYTMQLITWWGVPMFFLGSLLMCLCGILLSKGCLTCFANVVNRDTIRDPYPQVADHAYGLKMKNFVIVVLNVSLLFACIVFLLLLGEIATQILPISIDKISHRNQLRVWFVICGIILLPFTFLGTPKDFWGVGPLASMASIAASILILLNVIMVGHNDGYKLPQRFHVDPETILAVFGTIQFTFGGISIFPTIQNDLNEPHRFPQAVAVSYCIVFFVYTGVSIAAFVVLDGKIQEDILTTFIGMDLYRNCPYFRMYVTIAQGMVCLHILCAFILIINPVNLQLEAMLNVPISFNWQRVVVRTTTTFIIIVFSTIVPNFGPVLSLAGGTLFTLLNVIFPIMFFHKLSDVVSLPKGLFLIVIMILSVITSLGNGWVELKNVLNVVNGKYEQP